MERVKTAILVSGRGTNMQALLDEAAKPDAPYEVARVICDRPSAPAVEIAERAGVETLVIDRRSVPDRARFERMIDASVREASAEYICLAGFMRILGAGFVARWSGRILNIHPSLLPAYPGLETHARVLADGTRIHGCTVHFVRAEMDAGPVIAQTAVPVLPGDDPETLAARVLVAEHRLYPKAMRWVAEGRVRLEDGIALVEGAAWPEEGMELPG